MNRKLTALLTLWALLLSGCAPSPAAETAPTPTTEITAEPTPTPEVEIALPIDPALLEPWQGAYLDALKHELSLIETEKTMEGYSLYDIDKDGVPELLFWFEDWERPETWHIYTYRPDQDDQAVFLGEFFLSHEEWNTYPDGNGILKYWCQMGAREVTLYQMTEDTLQETTVFPDTVSSEDLLKALFPKAHPLSGSILKTDLKEMFDLLPLLTYDLPPWQAAYLDILLHPEEYGEIYAVTDEDADWLREVRGVKVGQNDAYLFSLCDLNGDEIPELLLGYGEHYGLPQLLLNILCWNKETGLVEDMDGPRTYGIRDSLWFFENGYFGTMNGMSTGLYTVFWKLEDTPGHYWDGYERPWAAYETPRPEEIFYTDSETGEIWSRDDFNALIGMKTVEPDFKEITEENIRWAFFPTEGEEGAA